MSPLELLWKLIGGDVGAVPQQPPVVEQPPPMSLKDRLAKFQYPIRKPDDLSGMGY